jgi:ATP-dependent Lhr-like helicase
MSKERRLDAEQRLKNGALKVLVATASLELGIDIGDVDLVCQLGSPRSIATFLQRAGRASHQVGGVPKARLFPLSRDELVECAALLDAVQRQELDRLTIPSAPLDVLAQQIVAEVAATEWPEHAIFDLVRRAYPYRDLECEQFLAVVRLVADGFSTRHGHRAAYVHRDAVNGVLRGRRGARLTALTSGGAIPDTADYDVVLEPAGQLVGTVNEDFAVESLSGDIFQLGNTSYRIQRIESGRVRVEDAHGQPPTIPFWLGEAPGRTDELSHAVSRLRSDVLASMDAGVDSGATIERLSTEVGVGPAGAAQLLEYLAGARAVLGTLPTREQIVLERFFDESGGMQLVIHSPFGSRTNRAWGLALRKRFCVKFNFELQAAATEDAIVLSLSTSHVSTGCGGALSAFGDRTRRIDPGDAGRADVCRTLALDRRHLAGVAPLPQRQEGRRTVATHARRRSHGRGVSRPDRVRRECRRRTRDSRPSSGEPGSARLPA